MGSTRSSETGVAAEKLESVDAKGDQGAQDEGNRGCRHARLDAQPQGAAHRRVIPGNREPVGRPAVDGECLDVGFAEREVDDDHEGGK